MSVDGWNSLLVLGGIRSGKSEFAESLLSDATSVRYVATAAAGHDDDLNWAARIETHQQRRPAAWTTEEASEDPSRLAEVIAAATPDETLLVDDLGGWVTVLLDPAHQPADDVATIEELAGAIRGCAARLVLVSPEVGLSLVPMTPVGRAFADALGSANQAVAQACDAVVLVVAGQPAWLKGADLAPPAPVAPATVVPTQPAPALTPPPTASPDVLTPSVPAHPDTRASNPLTAPTMTLPMIATGLVIQQGMELPMPDEYAGPAARHRLAGLDVPGAGLGNLERVVAFAAGTQGTQVPAPWRSVRVLLLHGDHAGGASAGALAGESDRRAEQARNGEGPLARLAAEAGASLQVVHAPTAMPMEDGPALSAEAVESALRYGWRLAEEAVDDGVDAIVLAACGTGTEAAAAAVLAATAGAEPAAVLGRVVTPGAEIDDNAWMARCAAVRDALHRTRTSTRGAKEVLAELGGGDIAIAAGLLLGATARRTPVLLDGPVGVAAALVSRDLAGQARHWCLLCDHGRHPAVRLAADVLGLTPLLDLRLDLGEGTASLAALPLLRSALTLAGTLAQHPSLTPDDIVAAAPVLAHDTAPVDAGPASAATESAAPSTAPTFDEGGTRDAWRDAGADATGEDPAWMAATSGGGPAARGADAGSPPNGA